jgi:hypothetical protein
MTNLSPLDGKEWLKFLAGARGAKRVEHSSSIWHRGPPARAPSRRSMTCSTLVYFRGEITAGGRGGLGEELERSVAYLLARQ